MRAAALVLMFVLCASSVDAQPAPQTTAVPLTLAELEAIALQNNPTVRAAAAAIDAARGQVRQAGTWSNPVVGYSGEELTAGGEPRGEHGFFFEQTIPLGGKLRLSRAAFEATVREAEAAQDLQRLRIVTSVRRSYYRALLSERRIALHERLAGLASEAVAVTAQLFNVGAADRPDYLESEIEARRVQLELTRAKNDAHAERQQLAALAGSRDVLTRPLTATAEAAPPEIEREQAIQALLTQSPELRRARAELERARALTARAQRATSPDLFLRAGAAYNRERGDHDIRPIGWEGNVEAGVSIPLFNRNVGAVAAARAEESRALANVARVELSLQARAADEFSAYLTALRASEVYRTEILPRAEEAYRLYLARYREMAAAYPQVLVAQRTLFQMSTEYVHSLATAWESALRLQGFLAGAGLDAPAGTAGEEPTADPGDER